MSAAVRRLLLSLVLAAGVAQPALAGQDAKPAASKAAKKADSKAAKKAPKKASKKASGDDAAKASRKARAKKAAGAAAARPLIEPTAKAPSSATEVNASAPLHRRARSVSGGLASARQRLRGPSASQSVAKNESQVERAKVRTAQRQVVKSPVESLLDDLRGQVVRAQPKARGKISVTFRVGRGGVPTNVLIFGFDDKLDVELEKQVQAARLPASYAGQQISTTLVFRGK